MASPPTRPNVRAPVLQMVVFGTVASALGIVLGLSIHWFPVAASTQAGPIDTLWDVLVIATVPIFVLVTTVVLFSVKLFRMRPGEELLDGPPIHGNTRLEVYWTAAPALMLIAMCSYAWVVLRDIEKAKPNELVVNVTGQQFAWTFAYPNNGNVKAQQLMLPNNRPVRFVVRSMDVIHDFWVPAFRMKVDAVPGINTSYRITPDRLGTYPIVCAELCGLGHAFMRNTASVVSTTAFNTWLAKQAGPPTPAGGPDPKTLFVQGNGTSTACGACHTLAKAGTTAQVGPDLGKVLKGKSADFIRTSIINPNAFIAPGFQGNIMPPNYSQTLKKPELDALVAYLSDAGGSGAPSTPAATTPAPPAATTPAPPAATTPAAPATTPAAPAAAGGNVANGKKIFIGGNSAGASACSGCHTLADAGTTAQVGPNLDQVLKGKPADFIRTSIVKPNAFIAPGFQANIMPPNYASTLSPSDLNDVVAYVSSVAGK